MHRRWQAWVRCSSIREQSLNPRADAPQLAGAGVPLFYTSVAALNLWPYKLARNVRKREATASGM